jgi:VanZ family protein
VTPNTQSRSGSPRRKIASIVLALALGAAVTIGSFLPEEDKQIVHSRGRFHLLGHFFVFSAIGFVASRAASTRKGRVVAFCAAVFLGTAIELTEHFAYQSALERKDILVDFLGVVAGTMLARITASRTQAD